jgi:hypothetical protein
MLETLLAEREIHRSLCAFARHMDSRQWAALDTILDAHASADYGIGVLRGRAAIVASLREFLDACGPTQHLLGNVVIDIDGEHARSSCYVSDMHLGTGEKSRLTFSTLGEYHDRWRRIEGRWWLVHRTKLSRALVGDISVLGRGLEGA